MDEWSGGRAGGAHGAAHAVPARPDWNPFDHESYWFLIDGPASTAAVYPAIALLAMLGANAPVRGQEPVAAQPTTIMPPPIPAPTPARVPVATSTSVTHVLAWTSGHTHSRNTGHYTRGDVCVLRERHHHRESIFSFFLVKRREEDKKN